jgi:anaerobic ribonucleoside-triphosphate reductase activating protein
MSGPLYVAQTHPASTVLGPGNRFVLWVQGCGIGCVGCVSPQWIPFEGGRAESVPALASRIVADAVDGLTISGGEPFAQADRLADLIETIRTVRDLSVMSYSGYTIEHLRAHGTDGQRRLLGLLDILVDGPYLADADDVSAGLQFEVGADATVRWLGVPTVPRFRERLEERLGLTRPEDRGPKETGS